MYIDGSEKYVEASENLRKAIIDLGKEDIETMDPITLKTIQAVTKFINASEAVIKQQEDILNTIDYKLDQLLKKLEAK